MSFAENWDSLCWYVIKTHPRQEDKVASNLEAFRIETFNPKIRDRRFHPFTDEPIYVVRPLFSSYIFAKFKLHDLYHKIKFTRGVHSVVGFNEGPAPIDDMVIDMIRSRMSKDGFVRIGEKLESGDRIIIQDGPLKNFTGIFEWEMKDTNRVSILLQTVGYQGHLVVERSQVKKLEMAAVTS